MPAEDVGPCKGGIAQHAQDSSMSELAPDDLSIPNAAVSAPRKTQIVLQEVPNDPIGTAGLPEDREDQSHGALDFGIRIEQNAAGFIPIDIAHRQRETELSALGLVAFAALEARADKMQLGLRHGAFEPEQELIVEIGRIVATIGVDNESAGQGADLQQAMPVAARAR